MTSRRELAHRSANGVEVTLHWDADTGVVSVAAVDAASGRAIEIVVAGAQALDAFRHPFAYAAGGGGRADQAARGSASRSSRATLGM